MIRNEAVALCRVSSLEQLLSNSLPNQKNNVIKAAETLGVKLLDDGIWEGHISSKVGVNYNRKDLLQIYGYCKNHKSVAFFIVQEVDRFMRSPEEQTYWYVRFWYELQVKIWFADKPELNENTHNASLFRFLEGWRASGSNEERKNKAISGHALSIKAGRYTAHPKPGYRKGIEPGTHLVDDLKAPILQRTLKDIAKYKISPTKALIEINKTDFIKGRQPYKMDKFRRIITDPYYAGILKVNKQVVAECMYALHEPLITKDEHDELVKIMSAKKKTQKGPRKNGNPDFPLSNIVSCKSCETKQYGRLVGFKHGNGSKNGICYYKYRCRSCAKYISRDALHDAVRKHLDNFTMEEPELRVLEKKLISIWRQGEIQTASEVRSLRLSQLSVKSKLSQLVGAATEPENRSFKSDIMNRIEDNKGLLAKLEVQIDNSQSSIDMNRSDFIKFALGFANQLGRDFFELPLEDRLLCKNLLFPAGFWVDDNYNVYTPEISPIYRLKTNKKDPSKLEKSSMVAFYNQVRTEFEKND